MKSALETIFAHILISPYLIRHLLSLYPSSRGCGDGSNVRSSPLAYYSTRFKLSAFHYRSTGDR